MMMTTSYYTVADGILGENGASGRVDYLLDGIGSVVATVDQTLSTVATARYKPFGAELSSTGGPLVFGWVGGFGYRKIDITGSEYYVRARHYGDAVGKWRCLDVLWPYEEAYLYGRNNPVTHRDPSGLAVSDLLTRDCPSNPCTTASRCQSGSDCFKSVLQCMGDQGFNLPGDAERIRKAIKYMGDACNSPASKTSPGLHVCGISMADPGAAYRGAPEECKSLVAGLCNGPGGVTIPLTNPVVQTPPSCENLNPVPENPCAQTMRTSGCSCQIARCSSSVGSNTGWWCGAGLFHELAHCAGFAGGPDHNKPADPDPQKDNPRNDFVYNLGCCMCREVPGNTSSSRGCIGCNKRPPC